MKKSSLLILGIIILLFSGISIAEIDTHAPARETASLSPTASQKIDTATGISDALSREVGAILSDREVQKTLQRIEQDKPKYRQDGTVFMNRERLLPRMSEREYYREWTVDTPGEDDRGPRRIVVGKGGELYFTMDHYRSFVALPYKKE